MEKTMKTPDEIKKGLECCANDNCEECPYKDSKCVCFEKDARAYIQQLESKVPHWISVDERLPEVDARYDEYEYSAELIVYDGSQKRVAYYCHTTKEWRDSRYEDDIIEVTHWMPLPEPPKEE